MNMNEIENLVITGSTIAYIVVILAEIIFSFIHEKRYYTLADTFTNVYLTTLNLLVDFGLRGMVALFLAFFCRYSFYTWENTGWAYWMVLFIAEDLVFYWLHRVDHTCRLFWAVHVTHHSSPLFNLTTGFRSSVFQPVYRFFYFIPLALMGFKVFDIFLMFSITQIYGILVHTRTVDKLGFLEHILVTPSHHRVHHASNVEYLDKNLGMVLIFWDKLFGTFQAERDDIPLQYGLFKKKMPEGPVDIVFHEWQTIGKDLRRPLPWRLKLKYLLMPPGWSHDGSSLTSAQLRALGEDQGKDASVEDFSSSQEVLAQA